MGTTAEKLSYLNETKTQIKNALETPYNVFRDYPAMIKKYIDNQPTKIATNGICNNAVELPIVSLKSKGNNYQETTQGKNLFDNTLKDYAYYGNLAKTISTGVRLSASSPTTTSDTIFTVYSIMDLSNFVGKTVRMKATYKSNSALIGEYKIGLCDDKAGNRKTKVSSSSTGQEISFVVPELIGKQKYLAIWFYANAGGTGATGDYVDYTNVIITIDNEDMTYEPYTGGTPSPNPEYPQEIETINSIGFEQSGKNKFDNFKAYSYSNSNLNTTSLSNGIKIEKKSGFGLWVFDNLENLDEKIVRAKSKFNDGGSIAIGLASLNGTSRTIMKENTKSDTVSSFVIPKITDDKKYLAVWLYGSDNSEISYEDLIVTIDNEDMTYEPYHEPKVISINLNGNTLAKVGDIKDKLIIHRNGEVELMKNIWKKNISITSIIEDSGTKMAVVGASGKKRNNRTLNTGLCTKAIMTKGNPLYNGTFYENATNFVFVGANEDTLETMKSKYDNAELYYQLETPQIIKLPSINPIDLWQGTNIFKLITNLETNFEVEYVVDKDSMLDEVQTAMLNAEIEI